MKILLVDDNEAVRDTLTEIIQGILGHEVSTASNGKEAADIYLKEDFPIVLSDINMPQMSGVEFLDIINKSPKFQQTRVVFFTISPDQELIDELMDRGASDIIKKPFTVEKLREIIEKFGMRLNFRTDPERDERDKITNEIIQGILKRAYESGEDH
ncbi:MAG: response regulator [Chloroflexota bacterium]